MPSSYTEWAATHRVPADATDAYDLYLEAHEQESRREFDEGNHDYTDFDEFLADDPPTPWHEFNAEWHHDQEQMARERRW